MDVWFENTAMGRYVAQNEAAFFEQHLQYFDGQTVVQQGGEWLRSSENGRQKVFRRPLVGLFQPLCRFQRRDFFAQVFQRGGNDGDEHGFADAALGGAAHEVAFGAGV